MRKKDRLIMSLKQCKECGQQISTKAIILGVMFDNIGYLCFITILGIALGIMGITENEINTQIETITNIILALGFTFLGGYIAGRIAKHSEVLHGGIVGAIGILIGFIIIVAMSYPIRLPEIVCFVGIIPIGMGGGCIARTRK
jgi:putative membrane protein (TIGR04086 family)